MKTRSHFHWWLALLSLATLALPSVVLAQHSGHGSGGVHHSAARVAAGNFHGVYHGSPRGYYRSPSYGHYYRPSYYRYRSPYWYGGLTIGTFVATLPLYYDTFWWGGVPYYYYQDTYYRWNNGVREYEVVTSPKAAPTSSPSTPNTTLFAYPTNGQSDEQQKADRYECYKWAADQTGFDPTKQATEQSDGKREDYLRAETACLSGRGYSVR